MKNASTLRVSDDDYSLRMSPKQKAQPQKAKTKIVSYDSDTSDTSSQSSSSMYQTQKKGAAQKKKVRRPAVEKGHYVSDSDSLPDPKPRRSPRTNTNGRNYDFSNSLDNKLRSPRNSLDYEVPNPKRTYVNRYFEEPPNKNEPQPQLLRPTVEFTPQMHNLVYLYDSSRKAKTDSFSICLGFQFITK
jgi:hypothetical protein